MNESRLIDIYGPIGGIRLTVTQQPSVATLEFQLEGVAHSLRFINPRPLAPLMEVFGDCWGIRVIDRNVQESNCLEFGRFRVEFWDEDNPIAEFNVDAVLQPSEA